MTATVGSRSLGPLAAPLACGCCLAAGAAYVVAVDPAEGGGFLPCPFRAATGWWCPGCGLTRATHHLFRGDVVQALRYHLFVVVVLGAIVLSWLAWLVTATGGRPWPRRVPMWVPAVAIVTLVGFAVVRNLRGVDGLTG